MVIIKVATSNKVKCEAVKKAFGFYFDDVEIISEKVDSGVLEQPINDEIFIGVENRMKQLKKTESDCDYWVSCEGGLIQQFGHWFNIQIVKVESWSTKESIGLSSAYPVPERYIEQILTSSLSEVLDSIFEGEGGIRKLTNGKVTRFDLVTEATLMALTGIMNKVW